LSVRPFRVHTSAPDTLALPLAGSSALPPISSSCAAKVRLFWHEIAQIRGFLFPCSPPRHSHLHIARPPLILSIAFGTYPDHLDGDGVASPPPSQPIFADCPLSAPPTLDSPRPPPRTSIGPAVLALVQGISSPFMKSRWYGIFFLS